MYAQVSAAHTWYSTFDLSDESISELKFWRDNHDFSVGYSFRPKPVVAKIVFCDASDHGYGGFLLRYLGKDVFRGKFGHDEITLSSTNRELRAVKYALSSLQSSLAHSSVRVYVDNYATSRILTVGSRRPHLQKIAMEIFKICLHSDIRVLPQWIPRELNSIADYYSKMRDTDDYTIDDQSFQRIDHLYGPHTFDRFADDKNAKTTKFNSKYHCPGSNGVDAFAEQWRNDNNWLCPPVSLIAATFRHRKTCRAVGTVIVPVWQSSYFWPILYPDGYHIVSFVEDFTVFDPIWHSNGGNTAFIGRPNFRTMALRCKFD
jgi:hypothetical protein